MTAEKPPVVASPGAAPKQWRVGTLTYTAGGLVVLFCWLLWGDFAWQLKERSVWPVVQIMLRKFAASDFLTGLFLLSLPAAVGVLLGPVVGYHSDRHRGRWGRRIPYLAWATPFVGLFMVLIGCYGDVVNLLIGQAPHATLLGFEIRTFGQYAATRSLTFVSAAVFWM